MLNAAPLELSMVHFTFSPPNRRSVKFICLGDTATERMVTAGMEVAGSVTTIGVTNPNTKPFKATAAP